MNFAINVVLLLGAVIVLPLWLWSEVDAYRNRKAFTARLLLMRNSRPA